MTAISSRMPITASQAPWVKRVTSTTASTRAESTRPTRFSSRLRWIAARALREGTCTRRRDQCRSIAAWLSVKETNTPST